MPCQLIRSISSRHDRVKTLETPLRDEEQPFSPVPTHPHFHPFVNVHFVSANFVCVACVPRINRQGAHPRSVRRLMNNARSRRINIIFSPNTGCAIDVSSTRDTFNFAVFSFVVLAFFCSFSQARLDSFKFGVFCLCRSPSCHLFSSFLRNVAFPCSFF